MECIKTHCLVFQCESNRIFGIACLPIKVSLIQPYTLSVPEINGGNDGHDSNFRKFLSSLAPAAADRSG